MISNLIMRGAEGAGASTANITTSLSTIKDIASWVLTFAMEHPILSIYFVSGLIFVGIKVVKAIIRAIKK